MNGDPALRRACRSAVAGLPAIIGLALVIGTVGGYTGYTTDELLYRPVTLTSDALIGAP